MGLCTSHTDSHWVSKKCKYGPYLKIQCDYLFMSFIPVKPDETQMHHEQYPRLQKKPHLRYLVRTQINYPKGIESSNHCWFTSTGQTQTNKCILILCRNYQTSLMLTIWGNIMAKPHISFPRFFCFCCSFVLNGSLCLTSSIGIHCFSLLFFFL